MAVGVGVATVMPKLSDDAARLPGLAIVTEPNRRVLWRDAATG